MIINAHLYLVRSVVPWSSLSYTHTHGAIMIFCTQCGRPRVSFNRCRKLISVGDTSHTILSLCNLIRREKSSFVHQPEAWFLEWEKGKKASLKKQCILLALGCRNNRALRTMSWRCSVLNAATICPCSWNCSLTTGLQWISLPQQGVSNDNCAVFFMSPSQDGPRYSSSVPSLLCIAVESPSSRTQTQLLMLFATGVLGVLPKTKEWAATRYAVTSMTKEWAFE